MAADHKLGGLTLGIKNIMQTRKIILIAKGEHKASIVEQAFFGAVTTGIPASELQLHPGCEVLVDAAAGTRIREKDRLSHQVETKGDQHAQEEGDDETGHGEMILF